MTKKSEIYTEDGVNLASKVPLEVAEKFRRQAKESPGRNVKSSLATAAKLWVELPTRLQTELLSTVSGDLYKVLVDWIRDNETQKFLDSLSPQEKTKILAIAKVTKESLSQKR